MEAQTCSEGKITYRKHGLCWFALGISVKILHKDVFSGEGIATVTASSHVAFNLQAKALRTKLKIMYFT